LVVDDHPVVRAGLVEMLRSDRRLHVVAQASNGHEAIERFAAIRPDVTLMDLRMPQMGGVEATERIRAMNPNARVIIMTAVDGEEDIFRGMKAGARGYILKDAPAGEVVDAVLLTMQGQRYLAHAVAVKLAEHLNTTQLSARELEVLQLIATGLSNKAIARKAGITEGTVKFHVNNILEKLQCGSRTQAVSIALKRGLIQLQ
jgi:DNA-binding NarL/FixJ family response regulator